MLKATLAFLVLLSVSTHCVADTSKTEVAIGGGVGGAIGAVVGEELGDREGAIVGSALGAAIGTAVATRDGKSVDKPSRQIAVEVNAEPSKNSHPKGRHCPPGQAKKGRC